MKQLAARGLLSAASAELKFEELVALYSIIGVQHTYPFALGLARYRQVPLYDT